MTLGPGRMLQRLYLPLTSLFLPRTHCPTRLCMHTSWCGTRHRVVGCGDKALVKTIAKHAVVPLHLVQIDKVECDDATGGVLVSVSLKVVRPPLVRPPLFCSLRSPPCSLASSFHGPCMVGVHGWRARW